MSKLRFYGIIFGFLLFGSFIKNIETMQDVSSYEKERMITQFADTFIGTGIDLARVTSEDLNKKIYQYVWRGKYIILVRPINNELYCITIDELEAAIEQKIKAAKKIYGIERLKRGLFNEKQK